MEFLVAALALVLAPLIVEILADPKRTVDSWRRLFRDHDDELTP